MALVSEESVGKYIMSTYILHNKGISKHCKQKKKGLCYWTYGDLEEKLHTKSVTLLWMCVVVRHSKLFHIVCQSVCSADLPLSSSADDLLAVPGASDGRHTHFVCVVNDEHEPAAFWCKHPDFTVVPRYKTVEHIEVCMDICFTFSNKDDHDPHR